MTAVIIGTSSHRMPNGRPTGVYAGELVDAWVGLTEAGLEPAVLSPQGGVLPIESRRPGHPGEDSFFAGDGGRAATTSVRVNDFAVTPQIAVVVGGHGAMLDLAGDRGVAALLRRTYEAGGVVAAVCHGVAALLAGAEEHERPIVEGRRVTCFSDDEERAVGMMLKIPWVLSERLTALGASVVVGPAFLPHTVTDGRLVTGQNPASAPGTVEAALIQAGRGGSRG